MLPVLFLITHLLRYEPLHLVPYVPVYVLLLSTHQVDQVSTVL